MGINWGAVPDWLAGTGAVVALLFARAAARSASRTNEHQAVQLAQLEEAERQRAEVQRRQQAERFAVWVTLWRDEGWAPGISLINANPTPIYNITLYCCGPTDVVVVELQVAGPTLDGRRNVRLATEALRGIVHDVNYLELMGNNLIQVAATFRDTANCWWYRGLDGSLHSGRSFDEVRIACINEIETSSEGRLQVSRQPSIQSSADGS